MVVVEEGPAARVFLGNLAFDEALADEDFARLGRVHRPEIHAFFGIDDNAVERRSLERNRLHRLLFPVRIKPAALDQVGADLLQPLGFDARDAAGKKFGRLGDFSGGDPLAGLLVECRTGVDQELHAACPEVMPRVLGFAADVAEQAGKQRAVDGVVGGWLGHCSRVLQPIVLGSDAMQLRVNIPPFAHTQRRQIVFVARLHQLSLRFLVYEFALIPLPKLEPGEKFGLLIGKFFVRGVGCPLPLLRPLAWILHGQRGGDHQHFGQAAFVARGDDHAPDAWVERQFRQFHADRRQRAIFGNGAEFSEQLIAIADRFRRRRFEEGERFDVAEAQSLHAQDDAGER